MSDSSSDTEDRNDIVKKVDLENEYNGVAIDVVDVDDGEIRWRRWRIPFPIVVIFILAVTAIVAIYYYFSE